MGAGSRLSWRLPGAWGTDPGDTHGRRPDEVQRGNRNATIRDLQIDGNHADNASDLSQEDAGCITFRNVDGALIEGVWCVNARSYGIVLGWSRHNVSPLPQGPSRRAIIVNNFVSNCGVGEVYAERGVMVTNGEYITVVSQSDPRRFQRWDSDRVAEYPVGRPAKLYARRQSAQRE